MEAFAGTFDTIDQLEAVSGGWSLAFHQLGKGTLRTDLERLATPDAALSRVRFNRALDQRGTPPAGLLTFGFLESVAPSVRWCGRELDDGVLLCFNGPGGFESVSTAGHQGFTFSIPTDAFEAIAAVVGPGVPERVSKKLASASHVRSQRMSEVRMLGRELIAVSRQPPDDTLRSRLEFELPYKLVSVIAGSVPSIESRTSRRQAVERARALIDERRTAPPTIRELCEHAGVSWRTLDYAFQEQFDMTPKAYLTALQMDRARRLLRSGEYATVAAVAQACGFRHMSKFSADYRGHFGELPSETMRGRRSS